VTLAEHRCSGFLNLLTRNVAQVLREAPAVAELCVYQSAAAAASPTTMCGVIVCITSGAFTLLGHASISS
jgi:hypothetical protein